MKAATKLMLLVVSCVMLQTAVVGNAFAAADNGDGTDMEMIVTGYKDHPTGSTFGGSPQGNTSSPNQPEVDLNEGPNEEPNEFDDCADEAAAVAIAKSKLYNAGNWWSNVLWQRLLDMAAVGHTKTWVSEHEGNQIWSSRQQIETTWLEIISAATANANTPEKKAALAQALEALDANQDARKKAHAALDAAEAALQDCMKDSIDTSVEGGSAGASAGGS